ncbi:hypothetical protein U1Q18_033347 [Sarracenia purpurea var. burkii]
MAAGTSASPHVIGSTVTDLFRNNNRTGAPLSVRISTKNNEMLTRDERDPSSPSLLGEGPSCIFVGPIETASKETLEALYRQARDAYYNGNPLIVDDMFDRVELKLRFFGSKYIVKYPRCSLRRQSTYADAEEDPSQVFALASIWCLLLGFGISACVLPIVYTVGQAYQDEFSSGFSHGNQTSVLECLSILNTILFMALGSVIGYPIASASGNDLLGPHWHM